MNKGLLALNIILLVAVGVIFVLFFGKKKGESFSRTSTSDSSTHSSSSYKIAYFDMDSVENNFAYWKDLQVELNKKEDSITREWNRMMLNLQQRAEQFEKTKMTMTQEQFERAQNQLMQLDATYKTERQKMDQAYQGFLVSRQQEILAMIREFFKEYNKKNEYAMIIANEPGLIFYKDTTYNITSDLLAGLDKIYRERKKNK
jgi:outer membrane protein